MLLYSEDESSAPVRSLGIKSERGAYVYNKMSKMSPSYEARIRNANQAGTRSRVNDDLLMTIFSIFVLGKYSATNELILSFVN